MLSNLQYYHNLITETNLRVLLHKLQQSSLLFKYLLRNHTSIFFLMSFLQKKKNDVSKNEDNIILQFNYERHKLELRKISDPIILKLLVNIENFRNSPLSLK